MIRKAVSKRSAQVRPRALSDVEPTSSAPTAAAVVPMHRRNRLSRPVDRDRRPKKL